MTLRHNRELRASASRGGYSTESLSAIRRRCCSTPSVSCASRSRN